jgi:hypothetical protein
MSAVNGKTRPSSFFVVPFEGQHLRRRPPARDEREQDDVRQLAGLLATVLALSVASSAAQIRSI